MVATGGQGLIRGLPEVITINGDGIAADTDNGALYNSVYNGNWGPASVVLGSDASIGNNGTRFDIKGSVSGPHTLTKVGSNFVSFAGTGALANIVISNGEYGLASNNGINNVSGTVTIETGARLSTFNTKTFTADIILDGGEVYSTSSNNTTNYNVTIGTGSTIVVTANGGSFESNSSNSGNTVTQIVDAVISGAGNLEKQGDGVTQFSGDNTLTGEVTVSEHLLILNSAGTAIAGNLNIGAAGTVQLAAADQIVDSANVNITTPTTGGGLDMAVSTILFQDFSMIVVPRMLPVTTDQVRVLLLAATRVTPSSAERVF